MEGECPYLHKRKEGRERSTTLNVKRTLGMKWYFPKAAAAISLATPVETNLFSVSTIKREKPGSAPRARAVLRTWREGREGGREGGVDERIDVEPVVLVLLSFNSDFSITFPPSLPPSHPRHLPHP